MQSREISPDIARTQVESFKKGYPAAALERAATAGDGILVLDDDAQQSMVRNFEQKAGSMRLQKFVPASGAATRMFKDVFAWRDQLTAGKDPYELVGKDKDAAIFFSRLADFAFWDDLVLAMYREDLHSEHLLSEMNYLPVLDFLLSDHGLDYAFLPKGLISFHRYGDHCRTAMEEHLFEGALFARDDEGVVRIHFTVSPDHLEHFQARIKKVIGYYEQSLSTAFEISWSIQKPSTDTIAVDMQNEPFREPDGSLLFRPGGHGALMENLNDLDADLIFVKNIDNVVPVHLKEPSVFYKKVLGGLLIDLQEKIFSWIRRVEKGGLSSDDYRQLVAFATGELQLDRAMMDKDVKDGQHMLRALLNRPIRVCGMVRNEGEPGGGPFWVRDPETGILSLQIVETSQIDLENPGQGDILKKASHFNPVDMVCGTKDYLGRRFDLRNFTDPRTGFISKKSKDGRDLKALELPGLWNGSMANWITLFVEIPIITFNPVKTVNDLLRKEHQPVE